MQEKDPVPPIRKVVDRELLVERRKEAIELYKHGWSQYQVAKHIGVSFEAVSNWVKKYKEGGLNSLNSLGKPGPKKKRNSVVSSIPIPVPPRKEPFPSKKVWSRVFKLIKKD